MRHVERRNCRYDLASTIDDSWCLAGMLSTRKVECSLRVPPLGILGLSGLSVALVEFRSADR